MKKRTKIILTFLLLLLILWIVNAADISTEQILSWQPKNLLLAAGLLLAGYAAKGATVFFPIMVLQILAGHIYSRETAIALNVLGLVLVMSIPYFIGRKLGSAKMEQLLEKYPKIKDFLRFQQDNEMAFCFMLRACAVPPADIVTMYLGASGIPFLTSVVGGVLGCFPSMVLTTFLGANVRNPQSREFWLALILNIFWVLLSGLGFWIFKRIHKEDTA